MENKVNAKIKKLINHIYGESFSDAHLDVLLSKLEQAAIDITEKRKSGWDEKDVVLITYADQFSAKGRKRCRCLPAFIMNGLPARFPMSIFYLFIRGPLMTDFPLLITTASRLKPEAGRMLLN
ncbi:sucrose phosphorylase [Enterobacter kobei]|nr:sucrose phosphorylase [Enterobacter kobei]